ELPTARHGSAQDLTLAVQPGQDLRIELANLLKEQRARRHDVRDARLKLDAAEVGHAAAAALLDNVLTRSTRVVGGAEERVLPPSHRRRARVVGLSVEREAPATDADDAFDDTDRNARGVEMRPLLDVELDVRRERLRIALRLHGLRRIEP